MDSGRYNDLLVKKEHSIIIVDDNTEVLKMCVEPLQTLLPLCIVKGFSVINKTFYNYIINNPIDLCILDVNLHHEKSTVDVSEEILLLEPEIIFLFISGYPVYNIDTFSHLRGRCIYDFMSKPFTVNSLLVTIISLLNISTTYKLIKEYDEEKTVNDVRKYYAELVAKDKLMIKHLQEEVSKVIKKDPCSCKDIYLEQNQKM